MKKWYQAKNLRGVQLIDYKKSLKLNAIQKEILVAPPPVIVLTFGGVPT